MWKAFIHELKNTVFSSTWSFIKHFGIILLPLLYGFMYIVAFFNPFANSANLDIAIVTSHQDKLGSAFANALGKNKSSMEIGELNMAVNISTIYASPDQLKNQSWREEEAKNHYATIIVKPSTTHNTLTEAFADTLYVTRKALEDPINLNQKFDVLIKQMSKLRMLQFYSNYQKNYLIAFGMDFSTAMQPVYQRMIGAIFETNFNSVWDMMEEPGFFGRYPGITSTIAKKTVSDYQQLWKNMQSDKNHLGQTQLDILLKGLDTVNVNSQMGEHAEYGFGLAPFFITLAMWIGSMGLTLSINGRIHKGGFSKKKVYMSKLLVLWLSVTLGAIILFAALAIIGFGQLQGGYWLLLFQTIISAILLSSIVFAIRTAIPNEAAGIIIVLILLVLQMASSGGLFATKLQFPFFQFMNYILPYTYSVHALREMTYDPNWLNWFIDIIIMLSFSLVSIFGGYYCWNKRKINNENRKVVHKKIAGDEKDVKHE